MINANLYAILAANFPGDKQACAIETDSGEYYTWEDLERGSAMLANLLHDSALPPGSRIAVQVEKSVEALILYLAVLRAGLVYVPLNTAYRASELEHFFGDAQPAIVVCAPGDFVWLSRLAFASGVQQVFTLGSQRDGSLLARAARRSDRFTTVAMGNDDLAAILYTSGTTGRSKGAMLSHGNLSSNAHVLRTFWGWQADDVLLHALPLFHVHGLLVACNGALINGSKMIFHSHFAARRVLADLPRATVFMGVPTFYTRLLAEEGFDARACTKMRLFVSGSAPLLLQTFEDFARVSGHVILERYGMSETLMLVSNPYLGVRIGGTVGVALPGVAVRVSDGSGQPCAPGEIGAIEVKGPNVFSGYWRMPDKTREEFTSDGYFITGDLGKWVVPQPGEPPYLTIVGRSKDLIITGGYNVYPKEVEGFIDRLPQVVESAVIGVPHPDFGEAVTAVVVVRADSAKDEQTIVATLKSQIANFKVPKRVYFVDQLPRNAMGKVQKNLLRERFASA